MGNDSGSDDIIKLSYESGDSLSIQKPTAFTSGQGRVTVTHTVTFVSKTWIPIDDIKKPNAGVHGMPRRRSKRDVMKAFLQRTFMCFGACEEDAEPLVGRTHA